MPELNDSLLSKPTRGSALVLTADLKQVFSAVALRWSGASSGVAAGIASVCWVYVCLFVFVGCVGCRVARIGQFCLLAAVSLSLVCLLCFHCRFLRMLLVNHIRDCFFKHFTRHACDGGPAPLPSPSQSQTAPVSQFPSKASNQMIHCSYRTAGCDCGVSPPSPLPLRV